MLEIQVHLTYISLNDNVVKESFFIKHPSIVSILIVDIQKMILFFRKKNIVL